MNKITAIALSFLLLYFITKPIAYTNHSAKDFKEEFINPSKLISHDSLDTPDFNPQEASITDLDIWEDEEQFYT